MKPGCRMKKLTLFQTKDKIYRILEIADDTPWEGDTSLDTYEADKAKAELYGMFGYVLEKWNPEPGIGYEHVDSCWGFVGTYNPNEDEFNHYIVAELKRQIED